MNLMYLLRVDLDRPGSWLDRHGSYSGIFTFSSFSFASLAFIWARDSLLGLIFLVANSVVTSEAIAAVKVVGREVDVVLVT